MSHLLPRLMPRHLPRHLHAPHVAADRLWSTVTMVLAAVGLILALAEQFDPGAVVATAGVLAGIWSMLISRTRLERFETVAGALVSAVVLATCLAYGSGLSG